MVKRQRRNSNILSQDNLSFQQNESRRIKKRRMRLGDDVVGISDDGDTSTTTTGNHNATEGNGISSRKTTTSSGPPLRDETSEESLRKNSRQNTDAVSAAAAAGKLNQPLMGMNSLLLRGKPNMIGIPMCDHPNMNPSRKWSVPSNATTISLSRPPVADSHAAASQQQQQQRQNNSIILPETRTGVQTRSMTRAALNALQQQQQHHHHQEECSDSPSFAASLPIGFESTNAHQPPATFTHSKTFNLQQNLTVPNTLDVSTDQTRERSNSTSILPEFPKQNLSKQKQIPERKSPTTTTSTTKNTSESQHHETNDHLNSLQNYESFSDDSLLRGRPVPPAPLSANQPMSPRFKDLTDDVFHLLKSRENEYLPLPDYWNKRQPEMTENMRLILVDWLSEVCEAFQFDHYSFHLCVNYLDRFLSIVRASRKALQLCGATALMIAAKYNETLPPCINDYVFLTAGASHRSHFLRTEALMLNKLQFRLTAPTVLDFIHHYIHRIEEDQMLGNHGLTLSLQEARTKKLMSSLEWNTRNPNNENAGAEDSEMTDETCPPPKMIAPPLLKLRDRYVNHLTMYLSEVALLRGRSLQFSYSKLAASCVVISHLTFASPLPEEDKLSQVIDYSMEDLRECMEAVYELYHEYQTNEKQTAVRLKYAKPIYDSISSLMPKKSIQDLLNTNKNLLCADDDSVETGFCSPPLQKAVASLNRATMLTPIKYGISSENFRCTPTRDAK